MREASFRGTEAGGRAFTVVAFAGAESGPAAEGESFLKKGVELSRMSRS